MIGINAYLIKILRGLAQSGFFKPVFKQAFNTCWFLGPPLPPIKEIYSSPGFLAQESGFVGLVLLGR